MYCYCKGNPVLYVDPDGNDAILITEYLPSGLSIVGHSVILIQDENGEWWITEYSGSDKSTAHVVCRKATQSDWERFKPQKGFWNSIKNLFQISGNSSVYLKGDYSNSLSKAQGLIGSDLGGYNLLTNNCLHYVKSILSETNIDSVTNSYFKNSKTFIPNMFTNMTALCNVIDYVIDAGNKVYNFIKDIFTEFILKEVFMKKIINKSLLLIILFIFIVSGCSIKREITFENEQLIYKDTYYSLDENYLPIICEGDMIEIDRILGICGLYKYYISSLDADSNIIYDHKNQFYKDGFLPPDDSEDNISKIYMSMSFKGILNDELKKTDVIQFNNSDSVYLNDIINECPIDEVEIHNKYSFWLFIIYENFLYMSIQYDIYYINNEIYFTKYYDNEHLYKVNDNYKNYFEESIIRILK